MVLSGDILYGASRGGGAFAYGTVFAVQTDGSGFFDLHDFSSGASGPNSDGANPVWSLVQAGNALFGTAANGGQSGQGTVFKLNTDGTGFNVLHSFTATDSNEQNIDGANPAGLMLSGGTLYGTTGNGGTGGGGTVFAISTNGTGFTILHSFTARINSHTNSDGASPLCSLTLSGDTLYGIAAAGGVSGSGTVFALNTDGTGFTTLHNFSTLNYDAHSFASTNNDGAFPSGRLVLSGNTLYGTASEGGNWGRGLVFSLSFTPQLTIASSGTNVILTWPTNVAGFDYTGYTLQSTTNLVSPVWATNSPAPAIVNGQYTVTNPISSARQFYRLSH